MEGEIKKYIDSVIPKNIPNKRKLLLSDELESHIYEKVERYEEIGYTTEQSIKKALEEMGEDEEVKKSIIDSFAEIYKENAWWTFWTVISVVALNAIAFVLLLVLDELGLDKNYTISAACGFTLIFATLGILIYARKHNYASIFAGVAISKAILFFLVYLSFLIYESTFSSIFGEAIYLLENYTPYTIYTIEKFLPYSINTILEDRFAIAGDLYLAYIIIVFIYSVCMILAVKFGFAKKPKYVSGKSISFGIIFIVLSVLCCVNYQKTIDYMRDYPIWFIEDSCYVSYNSEKLYWDIKNMDSYEEASSFMKSNGYINIDDYVNSLDRIAQKQFAAQAKSFKPFDAEYEIWLNPDEHKSENYVDGNGFVFLKKDERGNLIGTGIGDGFEMYREEENQYQFGGEYKYSDNDFIRTEVIMNCFKELEPRCLEEDVINWFCGQNCTVYAKFKQKVDGKTQTYYRMKTLDYWDSFKDKHETVFIEFSFENGLLTDGTLYDTSGDFYKTESKEMLETINLRS